MPRRSWLSRTSANSITSSTLRLLVPLLMAPDSSYSSPLSPPVPPVPSPSSTLPYPHTLHSLSLSKQLLPQTVAICVGDERMSELFCCRGGGVASCVSAKS
eukprot:751939-Hanusia_phi.AAC.4